LNRLAQLGGIIVLRVFISSSFYYLSLSFFFFYQKSKKQFFSAIENQSSSKSQRTKICTQNREHFFGRVENGVMELSDAGRLVERIWDLMPEQFPNISLGAFVVMPNHVHGIVFVDVVGGKNAINRVGGTNPINRVSTDDDIGGFAGENNPMLYNGIAKAIRCFKGRYTFEIKSSIPHFAWQARFHDHIIRNEEAFLNIWNYIENNPKKWKEDLFYK
jgi:putative transposase